MEVKEEPLTAAIAKQTPQPDQKCNSKWGTSKIILSVPTSINGHFSSI